MFPVPPEIETQPGAELVTRAGQAAELECRVIQGEERHDMCDMSALHTIPSGTPTPSLTWRKEGAHATEDLSAQVTHSEGGQVSSDQPHVYIR